jgi:hypothetical protein
MPKEAVVAEAAMAAGAAAMPDAPVAITAGTPRALAAIIMAAIIMAGIIMAGMVAAFDMD